MKRMIAAIVGCVAMLALGATSATAAVVLPPGFVDERLGETVVPTSIAFLPDGTMLVASKVGHLYAYEQGNAVPRLVLDIRSKTCMEEERGLLGLAVDPAFESNRWIYLYYTRRRVDCSGAEFTGAANRVSRFTIRGRR